MKNIRIKLKYLLRGSQIKTWLRSNATVLKKSGKIVVGTLLVAVIAQLAYPQDRGLPLGKVETINTAWLTRDQIRTKINEAYKTAEIKVTAAEKTYQQPAFELGLSVDDDQTASRAVNYPLWQRLIPFSIFKAVFSGPRPVSLQIDTPKLKAFADQVEAENLKPAADADILLNNTEVEVVEGVDGQSFGSQTTVDTLQDIRFLPSTRVVLQPDTIKPSRSAADLQPLLEQVRQIINKKLSLNLDGEIIVVDQKTLASWVTFNENKANELTVGVDGDALKKYLNSIQMKVYIAPGVTVINTLDGKETSRITGTNGQGISTADVTKSVQDFFAADLTEKLLEVPLTTLAPSVKYNRSYSQTQVGLAALLKDIATEKGDFAISVNELSGQKRVASANGDKQYVPASTYKLFVAYSVLKNIENSSWQWSTKIEGSKNVSDCFELMIVRSDNPCAEAFGEKIGWTNIHNQMRALGLGSTVLNSTEFKSTTADEALFLRKLQDGSLLKTSSRDKLLDAMKRQIYRAGIPAGVGHPVADKVGFLEGYLHDAAIVYGPGGKTYVVVIFSYQSTWGNIAEAARQIQQYFGG